MTTHVVPLRAPVELDKSPTRVDQVAAHVLLSSSLLYGLGVFGFKPPIPLGLYVAAAYLGLAVMVAVAPRGSVARLHVSLSALAYLSIWLLSGTWSPITGVWFAFARQEVALLLVPMLAAAHLRRDRVMPTILFTFYFTMVWQLYGIAVGNAFSNLGFRGSFVSKNTLGAVMALAIIAIFLFERRRERQVIGLSVAVLLLALSTSVTGLVMAVVGVTVVTALNGFRSGDPRRATAVALAAGFLAVGALVLVLLQASAVLGLLGKDSNLSGRRDVWPAVIDAIQEEPVTGYGLSPWLNRGQEPGLTIVREAGFSPSNAHNTVLEIMLLFGVVGLIPYLLMFFSIFVAGWRSVMRYPDLAALTIASCLMLAVRSYSEVTLSGFIAFLVVLHVMIMRRRTDDARAALAAR